MGPAFNLLVVVVAGIAFRVFASSPLEKLLALQTSDWRLMLFWIAVVNTFLFIINILPIPPLDGSKILARFLSPMAAMKMEEYGQYLFLFLIVLFLIFKGVIGNIAAAVYEPILGL
jgi:Zn-dependent protease